MLISIWSALECRDPFSQWKLNFLRFFHSQGQSWLWIFQPSWIGYDELSSGVANLHTLKFTFFTLSCNFFFKSLFWGSRVTFTFVWFIWLDAQPPCAFLGWTHGRKWNHIVRKSHSLSSSGPGLNKDSHYKTLWTFMIEKFRHLLMLFHFDREAFSQVVKTSSSTNSKITIQN